MKEIAKEFIPLYRVLSPYYLPNNRITGRMENIIIAWQVVVATSILSIPFIILLIS